MLEPEYRTPEYWRRRADAFYAQAAQLQDPDGKRTMIQIAEIYVAMARYIEIRNARLRRLCYPFGLDWRGAMPSNGRPWHGGRVLVCDDSLLMAEVICEFLRESGLEPIGPAGA